MWLFVVIPFFIQAIAIGIDEVYFHWKRGLPFWERIGHPIDTLSLLVCMIMVLTTPFTQTNLLIYCGLAVFSCLMVTKDEFIHKTHCPGAENWLHALLFILHPITLAMTAIIWPTIQGVQVPWWISLLFDDVNALNTFLYVQATCVALFFLYQAIFWNFIWKNSPVFKH